MEQPDFSHRVKKIEDPEEKRLAIVKATQSIEKKFGSNTILNEEEKQLNMYKLYLRGFCLLIWLWESGAILKVV